MTTRPITLELASARPSDELHADFRAPLVGVIDDLVALLEAQFPTGAEFPSEALRTRLRQACARLHDADAPSFVPAAGLRLVADASQAYSRMAGHVASREAEFIGVIRLLRELADGLRGDAVAFRGDLLRSSARVADLTQIEDIRTLRRALNREVDQLRQCVQQGEQREASRFAEVAGDLHRVDQAIAAPAGAESHDRRPLLAPRAALLAQLGASRGQATLVLCRVDDPDAIIDGHGTQVLDRVLLALAHLLGGAFGADARVYRTSTECVAMFLPRAVAKHVAQEVRKVQARVAPEYEYERQGVTRRVVFTFSAVVTCVAGKHAQDALEALATAEQQASSLTGLSQLHVEASGLGRLVEWLSAARG